MTDDAELIARLRALDLWPHSREAATVLDAADALEQRTRTITALQESLDLYKRQFMDVVEVASVFQNGGPLADKILWGQRTTVEGFKWLLAERATYEAALTAATQRTRAAEATERARIAAFATAVWETATHGSSGLMERTIAAIEQDDMADPRRIAQPAAREGT